MSRYERQKTHLEHAFAARARIDGLSPEQKGQLLQAKLESQKQLVNDLLDQSGLLTLIANTQNSLQAEMRDVIVVDHGIQPNTQENQKISIDHAAYTQEARVVRRSFELTWNEHEGSGDYIEVGMNPDGNIVFGNSIVPIPKFIWKTFPHVIESRLQKYIQHPGHYKPDIDTRGRNYPGMGDW